MSTTSWPTRAVLILEAQATDSLLQASSRQRAPERAWKRVGARASRPQQAWHSLGYLPHWEAGEVPQHVVFRLHDILLSTPWER